MKLFNGPHSPVGKRIRRVLPWVLLACVPLGLLPAASPRLAIEAPATSELLSSANPREFFGSDKMMEGDLAPSLPEVARRALPLNQAPALPGPVRSVIPSDLPLFLRPDPRAPIAMPQPVFEFRFQPLHSPALTAHLGQPRVHGGSRWVLQSIRYASPSGITLLKGSALRDLYVSQGLPECKAPVLPSKSAAVLGTLGVVPAELDSTL
jgi:hypothetical protein